MGTQRSIIGMAIRIPGLYGIFKVAPVSYPFAAGRMSSLGGCKGALNMSSLFMSAPLSLVGLIVIVFWA